MFAGAFLNVPVLHTPKDYKIPAHSQQRAHHAHEFIYTHPKSKILIPSTNPALST